MPRRCRLPQSSDASASTGSSTIADPGVFDLAPQPRLRGNYAGFLPGELVNQLNASAASGAGLALVDGPSAAAPRANNLVPFLALAALFYFGSRNR